MSFVSVTSDGVIWLEKDKDARLNYAFKLDEVLPVGDTLSSLSWAVTPNGGLGVDEVVQDGSEIRVVLHGGVDKSWYAIKFRWTGLTGLSDEFVVRVFITQDAELVSQLGSDLFPNRFSATAGLRRDRLMLAASTVLAPAQNVSDEYLWDKLRVAESEVRHILRVPFAPTRFMPRPPTSDELAALAGMPWQVDPGYDYDADFFQGDRWGFMRLRNKPLISVESVRIRFPTAGDASYTIPADWIRFDAKYSDVQFVPMSGSGSMPLNAFMLQAMSMGRRIPFAIEAVYTAGLSNIASTYPELVDVVRKKAVLSIIEDAFLPQSGSVSADGLSQSLSVDMDKYRDTIDHALNGRKGANGGLVAAIHGIRLGIA